MEATLSMKQWAWHHGKDFFASFQIRLTWENKHDRSSRRAPFLPAFNPLTPWQGGPAPRMTRAACENSRAHWFTTSSSTTVTSSKCQASGKWELTTRWASFSFSTLTWPMTSRPSKSAATRSAPMPSKSPIVRTRCSWRNSGSCPRSLPCAARHPARLNATEAQTPPPEVEASLHVTCSLYSSRKSKRASGISATNLTNSSLHWVGSACTETPSRSNDSINGHMALRHPNNCRLNMAM